MLTAVRRLVSLGHKPIALLVRGTHRNPPLGKFAQSFLHALRHTFATLLHANGANQAIAMQAMRHSDPRLTAVTYNDATLLPVAAAISELPSLEEAPIYSPKLFSGGQNLSQPVAQQLRNKGCDSLEDKSQRLDLAQFDGACQMPAMAPAVGFEPTTVALIISQLQGTTHTYTHTNYGVSWMKWPNPGTLYPILCAPRSWPSCAPLRIQLTTDSPPPHSAQGHKGGWLSGLWFMVHFAI